MPPVYPDLKITVTSDDTPLKILNKAQKAVLTAKSAGVQFQHDPREVAFNVCGMESPTKKQLLDGVPAEVYVPLTREDIITALSNWITVEVLS